MFEKRRLVGEMQWRCKLGKHTIALAMDISGPFAANLSHGTDFRNAGEQATHWDIQNKENSSMTG